MVIISRVGLSPNCSGAMQTSKRPDYERAAQAGSTHLVLERLGRHDQLVLAHNVATTYHNKPLAGELHGLSMGIRRIAWTQSRLVSQAISKRDEDAPVVQHLDSGLAHAVKTRRFGAERGHGDCVGRWGCARAFMRSCSSVRASPFGFWRPIKRRSRKGLQRVPNLKRQPVRFAHELRIFRTY